MNQLDVGEILLNLFPVEVLEKIFLYLDGATIAQAHGVCRQWDRTLQSLTSSSRMWFNCCKSEIPRYALMRLCKHPIDSIYRHGEGWRDVYVEWYSFRSSQVRENTKEEVTVKKAIFQSPNDCDVSLTVGMTTRMLCLSDDVIFEYDIKGELVAYDIHSEATRRKAFISKRYPVAMTTTEIRTHGKTTFEETVDRSILCVLHTRCLELYVGLEFVMVHDFAGIAVDAMCSWFDTILVPVSRNTECFDILVLKLQEGKRSGGRDYTLTHTQTLSHTYNTSSLFDLEDHTLKTTITGDRVLSVAEPESSAKMWDISTGELQTTILFPGNTWQAGEKLVQNWPVSWVGNTIATVTRQGICAIVLVFLDEECRRTKGVSWIYFEDGPFFAIQLLHDDGLLVMRNHVVHLFQYGKSSKTCTKHKTDLQEEECDQMERTSSVSTSTDVKSKNSRKVEERVENEKAADPEMRNPESEDIKFDRTHCSSLQTDPLEDYSKGWQTGLSTNKKVEQNTSCRDDHTAAGNASKVLDRAKLLSEIEQVLTLEDNDKEVGSSHDQNCDEQADVVDGKLPNPLPVMELVQDEADWKQHLLDKTNRDLETSRPLFGVPLPMYSVKDYKVSLSDRTCIIQPTCQDRSNTKLVIYQWS
ncbi:uncharacterized protein [Diadema setosum]|uniref:uncharacterized protein n=1 Tax=Diadema setosum TaxID=31175 RepID=UPI003B3B1A0E